MPKPIKEVTRPYLNGLVVRQKNSYRLKSDGTHTAFICDHCLDKTQITKLGIHNDKSVTMYYQMCEICWLRRSRNHVHLPDIPPLELIAKLDE